MNVKATRTGNDFRVTLSARQHKFSSDVGTSGGGADSAPNPHELLAASLAACTSMTVQMYANRKQWPLKSCDVDVSLDDDASAGPDSKTLFNVAVTLQGELDSVQRAKLMDIASRCPVHRALMRPIQVQLSESASS
jgi:putative redox protein